MGRYSRFGNALYSGQKSIDFVGRKWLWYSISGVLIVIAIAALLMRGLNLGIEFKGGSQFSAAVTKTAATQANVDKVRTAVAGTGLDAAKSPVVTSSGGSGVSKGGAILVTTEEMNQDDADKVEGAIAKALGIAPNNVSENAVGASWGSQVATRALTGLIVFLVLVVLFIWAYFREWKMSVGGLVALAHDIVLTAGVYSLSGFEVTPATVTGFLTILGFSLYDTVVVFDKVRENTKDRQHSRRTYAQLANLAVNQTLVRSINTSIVALLPVAALLYVSITTLGSGDLKDLSLSLLVGMAAGTYSSIFIATPLVAQLKQREKEVSLQDRRAVARSRRDADRYADVPAVKDDLPASEQGWSPDDAVDVRDASADAVPEEPGPVLNPVSGTSGSGPRRPEASGSGRIAPAPKGPVTESRSAGRNQPSRKPRSKRGK